jgi:hypothetical protein
MATARFDTGLEDEGGAVTVTVDAGSTSRLHFQPIYDQLAATQPDMFE